MERAALAPSQGHPVHEYPEAPLKEVHESPYRIIYEYSVDELRVVTVVHADANSGNLSIDGAGAHLVRPGDMVTLSAFAWLKEKAAREHQPRRVTVDGHNSLVALAQPESAKAESKKKKKN